MTAVVSYRNLIDAAASVLTLPMSTAEADHPISNLKLRGLGEFVKLDDDDEPLIIDVDFGSLKTFNFIAALGLGTTVAGGPGTFFAIYYATSADGVTYTPWTEVIVNDYAVMGLPGTVYAFIPAGITTRYLRVDFDWVPPAPKQLGRLWVDRALILADAVEDSAEFGFVDPGELSETDGQQYVETLKLRTKRLQISLRGMTTLQAWGFSNGDTEAEDVPSINGMQFAAGLTGEVIVLPIAATAVPATDTLWQRRTGVYGHVISAYSITRDQNSESWQTSLTVQEER